jgi:hypothetical protein
MVATCANPEQSLNTVLSKNMQKEAGLVSPNEAVLNSSDTHETSGISAAPSKNRESFLVILLRALGAPHI